jgi:hypothetical protein
MLNSNAGNADHGGCAGRSCMRTRRDYARRVVDALGLPNLVVIVSWK